MCQSGTLRCKKHAHWSREGVQGVRVKVLCSPPSGVFAVEVRGAEAGAAGGGVGWMWPGGAAVLLRHDHLSNCWEHSPWVHCPGTAHRCLQPQALLHGLLGVGGGPWREGRGPSRPEWAVSSQPQAQGFGEGVWAEELMGLRASAPADLCAGGAVRRGHRGAGAADVPHAGDQGAALHFPGGLSVLRRCPAVRPGGKAAQTGSSWPGLGLWASGAGPRESSGDTIHPAHWENLSTLSSLCYSTHTERTVGFS